MRKVAVLQIRITLNISVKAMRHIAKDSGKAISRATGSTVVRAVKTLRSNVHTRKARRLSRRAFLVSMPVVALRKPDNKTRFTWIHANVQMLTAGHVEGRKEASHCFGPSKGS